MHKINISVEYSMCLTSLIVTLVNSRTFNVGFSVPPPRCKILVTALFISYIYITFIQHHTLLQHTLPLLPSTPWSAHAQQLSRNSIALHSATLSPSYISPTHGPLSIAKRVCVYGPSAGCASCDRNAPPPNYGFGIAWLQLLFCYEGRHRQL
jgi:hypothetical protein